MNKCGESLVRMAGVQKRAPLILLFFVFKGCSPFNVYQSELSGGWWPGSLLIYRELDYGIVYDIFA